MSQFDEQFPEDLRDIAARLSQARTTPSSLELDGLRQQIHGRVARAQRAPKRSGFARLRMNVLAVFLTAGLVLTSGTGIVLACTVLGGGGTSNPTWPITLPHADWCEYHGPWTGEWSWKGKTGTVYVSVTWDCKHLWGTISCNGKPITWQWDGGPNNDANVVSVTTSGPNGAKWLHVGADGTTGTANIGYS
jgi:hypothetical protein